MNFAQLFAKMKLSDQDAEIIFDQDEPIGASTDLVMPRRRWFGREGRLVPTLRPEGGPAPTRSQQPASQPGWLEPARPRAAGADAASNSTFTAAHFPKQP